jgi:hypothetical protein
MMPAAAQNTGVLPYTPLQRPTCPATRRTTSQPRRHAHLKSVLASLTTNRFSTRMPKAPSS